MIVLITCSSRPPFLITSLPSVSIPRYPSLILFVGGMRPNCHHYSQGSQNHGGSGGRRPILLFAYGGERGQFCAPSVHHLILIFSLRLRYNYDAYFSH